MEIMSNHNKSFIKNHSNQIMLKWIYLNFSTKKNTANDASGRYRGQFLTDNNYWLGSMPICNELKHADEMDLNFFVSTTLIHSPDPLIKVSRFRSLLLLLLLFLFSLVPLSCDQNAIWHSCEPVFVAVVVFVHR